MSRVTPLRSLGVFYLLLVAVCTSAIWLAGPFYNNDGLAHVNNASMMIDLLSGGSENSKYFELNTLALPNSIGHWLLVLFLLFVSSDTATKLLAAMTFALWVGAAGLLRYKTTGTEGVRTSMLFMAAVSFNWLWFSGTYNFCLGVAIFIIAVALFYRWKEELSIGKTAILSGLFVLAYVSHLLTVAALAGSIFMLTVFPVRQFKLKTLVYVAISIIPIIPLLVIYRQLSKTSDTVFSPVWMSLENVLSPLDWMMQFRSVDTFILISRKTLPFIEIWSDAFIVFWPFFWIVVGIVLLCLATFRHFKREGLLEVPQRQFLILCAVFLIPSLFGPDHFGSEHGTLIRERVFILALFMFVPVFRLTKETLLPKLALGLLVFVIGFQTLALWEYSMKMQPDVREILLAGGSLPDSVRIASVSVVDAPMRFHLTPVVMANNLNGIGRDIIVWDNYELGHYFFPVVAKRNEDKEFINRLTRNSAILTHLPKADIGLKIEELDSVLADDSRIDFLLVWGRLPELDAVIGRHFDSQVVYDSGKVRIFQHKDAAKYDTTQP